MAMLYVSIVSAAAVQKLGEGALRAPVGTGPFKGFVIHPVEYNLGLWKTWLDK